MKNVRPYGKVIFFLVLLTLLDFLLRKGFVGHFLSSPLPQNINVLILFTVFAGVAWLITKRFAVSDHMRLDDLGISVSRLNQRDFFVGFLLGVVLWGIVSISQSLLAGFSWELRTDFNPLTLIHGLLFIFIADLGTELYMRGYPLAGLEKGLGAKVAIAIMVFFEVVKSFVYNFGGDIFFYAVLIPVLHIVFFSIMYFKTRRLGVSLGVHTGANFITICIFDLRTEQPGQAIPSGVFQANADLETLSMHALQLPWVVMAVVLSVVTYVWWVRR